MVISRMSTAMQGPYSHWRFRRRGALGLLLALTSLSGCAPYYARPRYRPAPCSTPVAPIRNTQIVLVLVFKYTYQPDKDNTLWHRQIIMNRLNELGRPDGNSFVEANGQAINFHLYVNQSTTLDRYHFDGNAALYGWGQGYITTQYINAAYTDPGQLSRDLADKIYTFIHEGWHDSRPQCPH